MTARGWETVPSFLDLLYNGFYTDCQINLHLQYNHYTEQSTIEQKNTEH